MLKNRKLTILEQFKTFDREINIEQKQIQKSHLTEGENYHSTQYIKSFFWGYSVVLISNS